MLGLTLLVLVMIFGRYERGRTSSRVSVPAAGGSPAKASGSLTRAQQAATVLGLIYCILAFVGFATSSFDGFAATHGDALFGFQMNPLQSLIHLLVGSIFGQRRS
jgi:hypothetical protein